MDDQQLWDSGAARLNNLVSGLAAETRLAMVQLLTRYRRIKENLAAVIADVDAASTCRECGGQCCLNGKYRINVLDSLACSMGRVETARDFFRKPDCPYGTDDGCTMEPGLRPADCILFICEAIERMLSPQARLRLAEDEQHLRACINEASRLTGERMGAPFLLWAERHDEQMTHQ